MILWWVAMVSCFYACDDSSTNTDPGLPLPGDFGQHVDQSLMHDAESRFDSGGTDIDALLSDSSMNTQDLNIPNDFSLGDQGVERFDRAVPQEPTLASTFFAGTHNSYSGGARGRIFMTTILSGCRRIGWVIRPTSPKLSWGRVIPRRHI